jgi:CDP-diglyceride synthetase
MKQRFITGLMLTAFLAINLWLPNWCMALATLICICFAVWEEYHALVTAGHKVVTWPTWVILGASMPLTWLTASGRSRQCRAFATSRGSRSATPSPKRASACVRTSSAKTLPAAKTTSSAFAKHSMTGRYKEIVGELTEFYAKK